MGQNGYRTETVNLQGLNLPENSQSYYEAVFTRRGKSLKSNGSKVERLSMVKKIPGTLSIDEALSTRYLAYRLGQTRDPYSRGDSNSRDGKDSRIWRQEDVEQCYHKWMRQILPMGKTKVKARVRDRKGRWQSKQSGRNELIATMIEEEMGIVISRKMISSHIQVIDSFTGRTKHLVHGWQDERAMIYMKWDKIEWDCDARQIMPVDRKKLTGDPQYLPLRTTNGSVMLPLANANAQGPEFSIKEMTFGLYASYSQSRDNNGIVHSYVAAPKAEGGETMHLSELPEAGETYRDLLSKSCRDPHEQVIHCEAALVMEPEYATLGFGIGTIMRASIYCRQALRKWCVVTHGFIDWNNEHCNERKEYFLESTQENVVIDTELHVSPSFWRDLLVRCSRGEVANEPSSQAMSDSMIWSQVSDHTHENNVSGQNGNASQRAGAVLESASFIQEIFQLDDTSTVSTARQRRIAVLLWRLREQEGGKTGCWSWKRIVGHDRTTDEAKNRALGRTQAHMKMQPLEQMLACQSPAGRLSGPRPTKISSQHTAQQLTHPATSPPEEREYPGHEEDWPLRKKRRIHLPNERILTQSSISRTDKLRHKRGRYYQQAPVLTTYMPSMQQSNLSCGRNQLSISGLSRTHSTLGCLSSSRDGSCRHQALVPQHKIEKSYPVSMPSVEILNNIGPFDEICSKDPDSQRDYDLNTERNNLFDCSFSSQADKFRGGQDNVALAKLQEASTPVPLSLASGLKSTPLTDNVKYLPEQDEQRFVIHQPQPRHLMNFQFVTEHNKIPRPASKDFHQTQNYSSPPDDLSNAAIGAERNRETANILEQEFHQESRVCFGDFQQDIIPMSRHVFAQAPNPDISVTRVRADPEDVPQLIKSETPSANDHTDFQESHCEQFGLSNMIDANELDIDDFTFDQWTRVDLSMEKTYYQQHLMMQQQTCQPDTAFDCGGPDQKLISINLTGEQAQSAHGYHLPKSVTASDSLSTKIPQRQLGLNVCINDQLRDRVVLAPYVSDTPELVCQQDAGLPDASHVDHFGCSNDLKRSPHVYRSGVEENAASVSDVAQTRGFPAVHVDTWMMESTVSCNYTLGSSIDLKVPRALVDVPDGVTVLNVDKDTNEDFELLESSLQGFHENQTALS